MPRRQTRRPTQTPGLGVDATGGPVVDPTENVLALVDVEKEHAKELRMSDKELSNARYDALKERLTLLSTHIVQFQDGMRDAETRRVDQLATTRQDFQNTIRDMLAESVRTTSTLVSTQLVQIQATFDTRVSKLEAGAFTQAGKSSVSDPATADALTKMAAAVGSLGSARDMTAGAGQGSDKTWAIMGAVAALILTAIGITITVVITSRAPVPVVYAPAQIAPR